MTIENIVMDFVCVETKEDCRFVKVEADAEGPGGKLYLSCERGIGHVFLPIIDDLSLGEFLVVTADGKEWHMRKFFRKPWRYDQVMRGFVNAAESTATVTDIEFPAVTTSTAETTG